MKLFFSALLSLKIVFAFAQSGNFFLSHYSPGKDRMDNICFQIAQHQNGMMYFATRSGMLQFDGRSWDLLNGNGAIYTIQITSDGTIYWGGANGYGIINQNEHGLPEIKTLSEDVKDIFQSVLIDDKIYFLSQEKLYVFDLKTKSITPFPATDLTGGFTGVFEISESAYLNTSKNLIYKISNAGLVKPTIPFIEAGQIVFSSSFKSKQLIGIANNEIYLIDKNRLPKRILLEDQQYLNESVVISGSWVNDDLIVLGTLRGGLLFINPSNGRTHEIINYSTGLPDNEIFTVVTDQAQCVWTAHEYGFTRIAPYLPFRSFSNYAGLSGNLLCAISFQNSVYVGTSLGLFKLEKEDVFEERTYYQTVPIKERRREKTQDKAPNSNQGEDAVPEQEKRKGLFRLFRRKSSAESAKEPATLKQEPKVSETKKSKKKILKTEKVLVTSNYRYKKVQNVQAKITQLHSFNGKLIACGLGGTFEIEGLKGKLLIDDPARYIYGSSKNILFVATYSDQVKTLFYDGSTWNKTNLLENLNDQVTHIFEGRRDELWLCALDKIYRLKTENNEIKDLQVIEIENPNYEEFVGITIKDECILTNVNGFYRFNPQLKSFEKTDSLSNNKLMNYFSRNESIWYRDSHGWNVLGDASATKNLGLLNLFKNIRFITPDTKTENLWVITNNNQLYKYFPDRMNLYAKGFQLVLKSVKNGDNKLGGRRVLDIDQDNSRLTFEVVQPDYLAAQAIEYRYHITGLEQDWTDWSQANNIIEIPYLPSGDYSLEVESKDIFGQLSGLETISLKVLPPYWKRPWFYALEVVLFTLFVILSFRLSTRYRIISRLLMLLTIIMLIQLVETIIGQTLATTTSPVIDFLIQVVIAMLVLPVEGYLRELMLRSLDPSNRFYRFIAPKTAPRESGGGEV
jgi:hypothetical protein